MGTWPNRIESGLLEAPAGTGEVGAGVQLYAADARQVWDNLAHACRGLAQLCLGSGGLVLSGTAFTTGTTMPAGEWLLRDNAGYLLYRKTTGATALEFVDTSGACTIYAVPTLRTDDLVDVGDADAAAAALNGIRFIAQLTASAAPSYGLPIGAGNVTASSFTSFTEAAGVRLPAVPRCGLTAPATGDLLKYNATTGLWENVAQVATTQIANDAVTYAKIQNVSATDKLLGRSTAGAGDVEEIACTAAGRALLDDANAAAQLTTLGVTEAAQTILDDTTVAAIITTLFGTYVVETDYFASSTIVGWAASPTGVIYYRRLGATVTVNFYVTGTSNATSASFTLPYQLKTGISVLSKSVRVIDNGATSAASGHCYMTSGSNVVTLTKSLTGDAWTNTGTKTISGEFTYICN